MAEEDAKQAALEAAARALVPGGDNERVADFLWPEYLGDATAAIEAYRAAMRNAGWVMVPVEPTEAMRKACLEAAGPWAEEDPLDVYHAAIAAAEQGA